MNDIVREQMEFDVLIIGGGPAGLSAAIRLKQLAPSVEICLIEKASEIGAHIVSGAVLEPTALNELFPDWKQRGAPLDTPVNHERMFYLPDEQKYTAIPMIKSLMPQMNNDGNYIISLGNFCRWLATQAEELGVEIFPGFSGSELIIEDGQVVGVVTGDMGLEKDGGQGSNHEPGMELRAKYTLFAEGCRGSLSKKLMDQFKLRQGVDPQTYGLGIKELWEIPAHKHKPGYIQHSFGWPLDNHTYGGSWLYHFGDNLVSFGFVVGLDYSNPWLSPFEETQRSKLHPVIKYHLEGGRRISYSARALSEGGLQSIPKLSFPGGLLIGDAAGFLNMPKIKGTHTAMKSGMVAAEAIVEALTTQEIEPISYQFRMRQSWVWQELHQARNIRPAFAKFGAKIATLYTGFDSMVRGKVPWTFHHRLADNEKLEAASLFEKVQYPKPDNELTFSRESSVFLSNIDHRDDQPVHLKLKNNSIWKTVNWNIFKSPETRYCPAGVYEAIDTETEPKLQINSQNCIHCKTCDIKDPTQNIDWETPEGGSGPNYPGGM
ncbi:Dehydrogenase (flavoprotein) (FixC) (PDB:4OPU) [Commensalibacter communis]|uniref:Electron transfer flavoprotein-ubiquinone oxidoreductase n=1 Tax=Commensalibacter communis TaxID=2972786 RepID=A0A9W4X6P3_9PROT|nr:electron transfer flavoprotein-ubiquinone oxidoreductase [Commensalibacter communis]CAI3938446.1 Dehydrogenase (flavoprotein) (FixC) (PDB:4OPU) [Commensalibacter communis]CAI3941893.1 Dehydrogenase (flavoprotein) (FixC) (PDB:4OPU) [Commensalibacter communis]CAI3944730.1 Dehydrogenase (flavoprotein) (FixC) (PDB:4OPU) [Commensalibacter communis]CAI3944839.1 Dehydrogenase (flavoprotein) (FixC) (PDB:4OPU) [Commensalibacter communis]CAI3945040.1 Dehydrogenase (flavoprotein) (FixC) (PDB:4OPU) [Co